MGTLRSGPIKEITAVAGAHPQRPGAGDVRSAANSSSSVPGPPSRKACQRVARGLGRGGAHAAHHGPLPGRRPEQHAAAPLAGQPPLQLRGLTLERRPPGDPRSIERLPAGDWRAGSQQPNRGGKPFKQRDFSCADRRD
mmetsp:Transcript_19271/g.31780  ORF Transcript_19271/g.31780 Transcript_19271/m.31780 type:complete len:139 (+) Transcript_19271:719-1135(+)